MSEATIDRLAEGLAGVYQTDDRFPVRVTRDYDIVACLKYTDDRCVWRIADKHDGRQCILKRARSSGMLLRHEFELLRGGEFSFCPKPLCCFDEDGDCWYIREYIEGDTLFDLVSRKGNFSIKETARVMLAICAMVAELHRCSPPVIHRDLKPQNIVIGSDGRLWLIDMETCRTFSGGATRDTLLVATSGVAAPEQYGFGQTTERSDIYSLGSLMLFLATGSLNPDSRAASACPRALSRIIGRCMRLDPDRRFSGVGELVRELRSILRFGISRRAVIAICTASSAVLLVCAVLACGAINSGRTVTFRDDMLDAAVRQAVCADMDGTIRAVDIEALETLIISYDRVFTDWTEYVHYRDVSWVVERETAGAIDLTELESLSGLSTLVIEGWEVTGEERLAGLSLDRLCLRRTGIDNLDFVADMSTLTSLDVTGNPIASLEPLAGLTALCELSMADTLVTDLEPIAALPLRQLRCDNSPIADFGVLDSLPGLLDLGLSDLPTDEVWRLGGLDSLTNLALYYCGLSDLSDILSHTRLESLDLTGCSQLTGVEGIESLGRLCYLGLAGTTVSDLSPLAGLTMLEQLDLGALRCENTDVLLTPGRLTTVFADASVAAELREMLAGTGVEVVEYHSY